MKTVYPTNIKNSLIVTNPHLQDEKKRKEMIVNFAYSCGMHEGLLITKKETGEVYDSLER